MLSIIKECWIQRSDNSLQDAVLFTPRIKKDIKNR